MVLVNMYLGHKGKRKEDFQEVSGLILALCR